MGNVTERFDYGPYGELVNITETSTTGTNTTDTPFFYNGRDGVMTDSNGLYYMRARYYNPDIKRFINQDVLQGNIWDGRTLNRYAYVNGNPVSLTDPFGLSPEMNASELEHSALDLAGFGPAWVGIFADATNAYLYWIEGDPKNAVLSGLCAFPGVSLVKKGGEFVVSWGKKGYRYAKNLVETLIHGSKTIDRMQNVRKALVAEANIAREAWKRSRLGRTLASNAGSVNIETLVGKRVAEAAENLGNKLGKKSADGVDFGKHLRNLVGDSPKDMIDPHAHHILFKEGHGAAQKALVEEGQSLLRRYNIDPIMGKENLVWAPNRIKGQHGIEVLENVVNKLKAVENMGGNSERIRKNLVKTLKELGELAARRR